MDSSRNITVNGKPLNMYIDRQSGKRVDRAMGAFKENMTRSVRSGAHSLASYIPTRGTTMENEKKVEDTLGWKAFYVLLSHPGTGYTTATLSKAMDRQANSVSVYTSKISKWIMESGEVDDVFKVDKIGNSVSITCKVHSIDNPRTWATKYHKALLEFDRVRYAIRQEEKAKKKLRLGLKKSTESNAQPETIEASEPVSNVHYNGNPVDIPIRISITVAVNFEKD